MNTKTCLLATAIIGVSMSSSLTSSSSSSSSLNKYNTLRKLLQSTTTPSPALSTTTPAPASSSYTTLSSDDIKELKEIIEVFGPMMAKVVDTKVAYHKAEKIHEEASQKLIKAQENKEKLSNAIIVKQGELTQAIEDVNAAVTDKANKFALMKTAEANHETSQSDILNKVQTMFDILK